MTQKGVIFKNKAQFRSYISKINNTFINNAEDLDIVMPMQNLPEYSDNYSMTSERLWNHYRNEVNNVNYNASDGASFKYKAKITGKIEARPAQPGNVEDADRPSRPRVPTLNVEVTILLKYFSNF